MAINEGALFICYHLENIICLFGLMNLSHCGIVVPWEETLGLKRAIILRLRLIIHHFCYKIDIILYSELLFDMHI